MESLLILSGNFTNNHSNFILAKLAAAILSYCLQHNQYCRIIALPVMDEAVCERTHITRPVGRVYVIEIVDEHKVF